MKSVSRLHMEREHIIAFVKFKSIPKVITESNCVDHLVTWHSHDPDRSAKLCKASLDILNKSQGTEEPGTNK